MGSYIFLESTAKRPIDWTESYWKSHKKPFGAEIFHETFTLYHDNIKEIDKSPYELFTEEEIQDGSYLFFNNSLYTGQYDVEKLLGWVEEGNTLFMSAEYLPGIILDTIGLKRKEFTLSNKINYQPVLSLDTISKIYRYQRNENISYFNNTDTLDVDVLGYAKAFQKDSIDSEFLPNFIKTDFGSGQIYLHLFPKAFTNYFLIDSANAKYTQDILKHLSFDKTIYVDQVLKNQKEVKPKHILQYLITNKYLKWAYYLLLLTGLIYIFFEGKRKQKAIKVLKPYENKTYAFTKTISDMYFRKQDHKSIATKLIEHFFDYVRDHYMIPTSVLDDHFVNQLASKSGQDTKNIRILLKHIKHIENQKNISKETLLRLEKQISKLKS
jgi:hypothetical protein